MRVGWLQLLVFSAMIWLALWAGVRVWISQPYHEHICPDLPACVCR